MKTFWKAVLILIFLVSSGILRAQDGDDPVEVMVSHDWYLTKIVWEGDEYPFDPETDNDGEQATLKFLNYHNDDGYEFSFELCSYSTGFMTFIDEHNFFVNINAGVDPTNCEFNEMFGMYYNFWDANEPTIYAFTITQENEELQLIVENEIGDKLYYQDEPYMTVSDYAKNGPRIYPNPAKEYLYFENLHQKTRLEILDIAGRKRLARELNGTAAERVHIAQLPTGIYFYRLQQNGAIVKTGKLVKR